MSLKEIEKLCASLSLKEREGPMRRLHDELKIVGVQKLGLCLAGRILSLDLINRDAFWLVISKIWRVRGEIEIEAITNNTYAFPFQFHEDRRKVLAGGLWSFDDSLIVLEEPSGKAAITSMKFNSVEFWVQISNIPILCMTKEIGCFLGSIIGDVRDVDTCPSGDCLGKFLRVRVAIEVYKPLRRFLHVDVFRDGEETIMPIQYEKLPNFCYRCGLLGHTIRECLEADKDGSPLDQNMSYGVWMKASILGKTLIQKRWGGCSDSRRGLGNNRSSNLVEEGGGSRGSSNYNLVSNYYNEQRRFSRTHSKGKDVVMGDADGFVAGSLVTNSELISRSEAGLQNGKICVENDISGNLVIDCFKKRKSVIGLEDLGFTILNEASLVDNWMDVLLSEPITSAGINFRFEA
ncbi:hypothetical protein Ddye_014920 [Dipteronia dyeriana]|uniref:CCHC-type domain-containing protein n=1 Tax=Dipteronia dyeriana TaxID=168575 RepID=A0AAD9WY07_9ROSI|nr:hypothetical protein Ddye_014920 [Dipteronia dyeriana]